MKLLLDECVDRRLAASFPDSVEVQTVRQAGWSGTKNGALLQRAADAGFDAVVTVDRNIEFQQNLDTLPVKVVVLEAGSSDLQVLHPLVPKAVSMLDSDSGETFMKVRMENTDEADEYTQNPKFF